MTTVLETIRGGLIASCQAASPDSPFRDPAAMRLMVEAVRVGGAVAARVESIAHVRAARDCGLPLVGLVKRASAGSDVYITPTVADVRALIAAGAAIVAADGTVRPREGGATLPELVDAAHTAGAVFMADVDSVEAGIYAAGCGADIVSTTLAGYTVRDLEVPDTPDIDLVAALVHAAGIPVVAEGRYTRVTEVERAVALGAHAVVVGTAISDPVRLTARFAAALPPRQEFR
ncbi:N-acetylmannosamine-6-phosphate 2-epimerase [Pseudolysinimonas kribbensis]|uniref:N-acetylmannosamine-6-phosphate 2-epimerase n=2 Tax=Pseudolysinimonas kribbensis TaxID=433641 RepID=UPI0031E0C625